MHGYLKSLFFYFTQAVPRGIASDGIRGLYLATCIYLLKIYPFKISIPKFSRIANLHEAENYFDNFSLGQLRDDEIENHLSKQENPLVIDIGVNIGITVRWWHFLNGAAKVIGIDMISEALDYTGRKLGSKACWENWVPVCAAVSSEDKDIEINFDDPLLGTNSLSAKIGKEVRVVRARRLDSILSDYSLAKIDLIKIDVEGHAGEVLSGAGKFLHLAEYVVVETHGRQEIARATKVLSDAGLYQYRLHGRMLWFSRAR